MKLPRESKFQRWKYLELARYIPDKQRVVRIMEGKHIPKIFEWSEVEKFRRENNNLGLYTSVFHYDNKDLNQATRLGSLYFDVDSVDKELAQRDAICLVEYLLGAIPEDAIRIYFTGKKGFHVECEAIALGIGPTNDLPGLFRYIANQIKEELNISTFDFAVYDLRRMWRLPNSQHQETGLFKVALDYGLLKKDLGTIQEYASRPHFEMEIPDQVFNMEANAWYREWQYKQETKSITTEDMIERFNRYGTGLVIKDDPDTELQFDPEGCFTGCPAMLRHWERAEKEHDLSHEVRLFLCSILTFTKESEWYLHQILKNCEDYLPEKTQAHIDDWKRRRELGIGGKPYSCARANQALVGCGDCNLEPKEKLQRVGDRLVRSGELASPSPIRFAYKRSKKNGLPEQDQSPQDE